MRAFDVAVREIRATLAKLVVVEPALREADQDMDAIERVERCGVFVDTERRAKIAKRLDVAIMERDALLAEIHRVAKLYPRAWAAVVRADPAALLYAHPVQTAVVMSGVRDA